MNTIVEVSALISIISSLPRPRTTIATFECVRCGCRQDIKQHGIRKLDAPLICSDSRGGCGRANTRFRKVSEESKRVDEKWIMAQELPEHVSGNDRPPTMHIRLVGRDLADEDLHQGDHVIIKGELKEYDEPDSRGNWKVAPETFIDCQSIEVQNKTDVEIYEEDIDRIEELAKDPDILENMIVPSIAPHVVGHDEVKAALAVQMFGGVAKRLGTKDVRGTIHVFLLGDPSTAKTVLVKSVRRMMPRAVYTTLPGSTKVGLTAAAVQIKEFAEGRWVIKAGVLPMANDSIAILDEIGQASTEEFKAIEECMSEGIVSKAASGETVNLSARTSILAAGNPRGGSKLDEAEMSSQVEMPFSTWTRFDLFHPIRDDTETDAAMRERLYQYHGLGEAPPEQPIRDELMRKYISWAQKFNPKITREAAEVLDKAHDDLRALPNSPFTKRTIETLLRIAQALARMNLSDKITSEHAEKAVRIHQAGWKLIIDECYGERGGGTSQGDRYQSLLNWLEQQSGGEKGDTVPETWIVRDWGGMHNLEKQKVLDMLEELQQRNKVFQSPKGGWGLV